jgi:rhodanese-related sulfurtransferase
MGHISINSEDLFHRLVRGARPVIIDVRRRQTFEEASTLLPAARWRSHLDSAGWVKDLAPGADVVVYCVYGHNVSQLAAAGLRSIGTEASFLEGVSMHGRNRAIPSSANRPLHPLKRPCRVPGSHAGGPRSTA